MRKKNYIIFFIFIILSNSVFFVFAVGISSPYWEGNPLIISPGKTQIVKLSLQNMVGTEEIVMRLEVKKGNEIATIEQCEYFVPIGTKSLEVPIIIKIPSEISKNTKYVVTIFSKVITSGFGGPVTLGVGTDTSFDVLVSSPEESENKNSKIIIILVVGIIFVLMIILYSVFGKR